MSTIVTRAGKGEPLTNSEVDANFSNLNNDKLEVEVNDLTTSVTWADVPDANITVTSVTQHQSALTITESQISDLQNYLTSETSHADVLVDGDFTTAGFMKTDGSGGYSVDTATYLSSEVNDLTASVTWANVPNANITESSVTQHQSALSITESQISDLQSYLTEYTETNDLSTAVTWANVPDANITQSSVTQHQGALSITESQISDLGTYLTAETNDLSTTVTWANVPDANITESSVTQHQAALSITESQISDLQSYLTSETSHDDVLVDGDFTSNGFMKRDSAGVYSVDGNTYLTTHQDISGKADLSGATFTGTITAPNVDISTTGSVTTNIASGSNNSNATDVKIVNIGTGYGGGYFAGDSTTINMGSQASHATNIFNIGNGTITGTGETTINLKGNVTVAGTVDGVDVGELKYSDTKYFSLRDGYTEHLSTTYKNIPLYNYIFDKATPVATVRILDLTAEVNWLDTIYNGAEYQNDLQIQCTVVVPSGTTNAVNIGTVTPTSGGGYVTGSSYHGWYFVSGDVTHYFNDFGRIHASSSGGSFERTLYAYQYDTDQDRTYFSISTYPSGYSAGTTLYWHPYAWESAGTLLNDWRYADEKGRSGQEPLNLDGKYLMMTEH